MAPFVGTGPPVATRHTGHLWWAVWVAALFTAIAMAIGVVAPMASGTPTAGTATAGTATAGTATAGTATAGTATAGTAAPGAGVLITIAVQKCQTGLAIPPQRLPRLPAKVKVR